VSWGTGGVRRGGERSARGAFILRIRGGQRRSRRESDGTGKLSWEVKIPARREEIRKTKKNWPIVPGVGKLRGFAAGKKGK